MLVSSDSYFNPVTLFIKVYDTSSLIKKKGKNTILVIMSVFIQYFR